jgi:hypothetical protein
MCAGAEICLYVFGGSRGYVRSVLYWISACPCCLLSVYELLHHELELLGSQTFGIALRGYSWLAMAAMVPLSDDAIQWYAQYWRVGFHEAASWAAHVNQYRYYTQAWQVLGENNTRLIVVGNSWRCCSIQWGLVMC